MTMIGESVPVRAWALRRRSAKRPSSPAASPAATACFDIFSPPPGESDVIIHFERESSKETKMALSCVWIAVGSLQE
jgi:hypothetical protein